MAPVTNELLISRSKPLKAVLWSYRGPNKGNVFAHETGERALLVHNSISVLFWASSVGSVSSFKANLHNGHDLALKAHWLLVRYRGDNYHESPPTRRQTGLRAIPTPSSNNPVLPTDVWRGSSSSRTVFFHVFLKRPKEFNCVSVPMKIGRWRL